MAKYNKKAEKNNLEELSAGKFACAEEYIASKNSCVNIYEICPISTRDRYRTALEKVAGGWVNEDGEGVVCKLPKNAVAENLTKKQLETDEYAEFDKASFIRCKDNFYPEAISSNNPEYIAKCTACPAGKKAKNASSIQDCVLECPSGSFCYVEKQKVCKTPVAEGETCVESDYILKDKVIADGGVSISKVVCPAGYFCRENTNVPISLANLNDDGSVNMESLNDWLDSCPIGYYCPQGSREPVDCDKFEETDEGRGKGFFCPAKVEKPTFCPAGSYCPKDKRKVSSGGQTDCPEGSYCPEGSLSPIECPVGSYCQGNKNTALTPCPEGSYCNQKGLHVPGECRDNDGKESYCPTVTELYSCGEEFSCAGGKRYSLKEGVDEQYGDKIISCKAGFYYEKTSNKCSPCNPGSYCPKITSEDGDTCSGDEKEKKTCVFQCPADHYCPDASMREPMPCGVDKKCPAGSVSPIDVSNVVAGSYSGGERYIVTQCKPGHYIDKTSSDDSCVQCSESYICSSGTVVNTAQNPYWKTAQCIDKYTKNNNQECVFDCAHRPAADRKFACDVQTGFLNKDKCNTDEFFTNWKETIGYDSKTHQCEFKCPANYVCSNNKVIGCKLGYYFKVQGEDRAFPSVTPANSSTVCKKCEPGYKCEDSVRLVGVCASAYDWDDTTKQCKGKDTINAGWYIEDGNDSLKECPEGHYCLGGSAKTAPTKCPMGTYNPNKKATSEQDCLPCADGTISGEGASACEPCSAGTFSSSNKTLCEICPDGHYSTAGSASCSLCPNYAVNKVDERYTSGGTISLGIGTYTVEIAGGGAGGRAGNGNYGGPYGSGKGQNGGSGAKGTATFTVTSGAVDVTISVGGGGSGGTRSSYICGWDKANYGGDGADSSFIIKGNGVISGLLKDTTYYAYGGKKDGTSGSCSSSLTCTAGGGGAGGSGGGPYWHLLGACGNTSQAGGHSGSAGYVVIRSSNVKSCNPENGSATTYW